MLNLHIFVIIIFLFRCITFVSKRKHLLCTLLRLEFIVLILFLLLLIYLNILNYEVYFRIFFLSFCVCEGVLGLSILVSIVRTHGNDYFQSFSFLQC